MFGITTQDEHPRGQPIRVVIGNPPYCAVQKSENANNQSENYATLDKSIECTYAAQSTATSKSSLYDSYVRAIRWASDQLQGRGIIAFITNGSFINGKSTDGMRRCLMNEFSHLYVFNLRGATRGTNRELELKEGENVFNIMTGVAIFLLIKTESAPNALGKLHYYDIGDSLSRDEKLAKIKDFSSIENIPWEIITPNAAGDWINQRGVTFNEFIPLENKIFNIHSIGVKSCCYALTYNSSRPAIERNVRMIIDAPNKDREKCADECEIFSEKKVCTFDRNAYRQSVYRPFHKQWLYFSPSFIQCTQKQSFIFPISERKNVAITCTGDAKRKGFSVLVINFIPDCQMNHGGKCFPLYFYEEQGTCGLIQSELL